MPLQLYHFFFIIFLYFIIRIIKEGKAMVGVCFLSPPFHFFFFYCVVEGSFAHVLQTINPKTTSLL